MTIFSEGEHVDYLGDGLDGLPPAQGKIIAFANNTAAHVEWLSGTHLGDVDMVSIYDLEKSASSDAIVLPTVTAAVLVRRVMHNQGTPGVLTYLAATHQLDTWDEIAVETRQFVESRLRADASMELPYEMLTSDEVDQVVTAAAHVLLRDKFSAEA